MPRLNLQPRIIGRNKELNTLQKYLERASVGEGRVVIISGEAGIGKTRLVNEVSSIAQSKGFQVLVGYSLHESLAPYMPFLDALRSGGLESLLTEEAPRVEAVYLVAHSGLLIKDVMREKMELVPDIFASMLTTVSNFVKESLSKLSGEVEEGILSSMGYQNYQILIESGRTVNLVVVITGEKNESLIGDMREILNDVEKQFEGVLDGWDGDDEKVKGVERLLEHLITSGRYDGIYYGERDPEARRNLMFENVSLGLLRSAQLTPTLLCIEDLQWADPSTLSLMHYVARTAKKSGLLILGTYRTEDVAARERHPLVETMQLMDREDLYEEMKLRRLPEETMHDFLCSILGDLDFDDEFKNRICQETEGNPLFIVQLVKFLAEEEIIEPIDGTWRLTKSLDDVSIPTKVYNVITRRLERVKRDDRKILDYAAVNGETFTSILLAAALDFERAKLLEQLRELEQNHRLINSIDGIYKFDHAKIKEVLYNEIPKELRSEYHGIIAKAIERLNEDDLDSVIEDLAFHYYYSGGKGKALHYLVRAAEKAKRDYSNEEAIRFYSEALEFETDPGNRLSIFMELGSLFTIIGDYDRSIESYNSALALTEQNRERAGIMARIGSIYERRGKYDDTLKICLDALDLVKGENCPEEAMALQNLGIALFDKAEYDKALEHYNKSLSIRESVDDKEGMARVLSNIGNIYLYTGDYKRALEFFERSLETSREEGEPKAAQRGVGNISLVQMYMGEYDKAIESMTKSLDYTRMTGDLQSQAYQLNNLGAVYNDLEEYDKAMEYYEKTREIAERTGDQWLIATTLTNIGTLNAQKGDYDSSLDYQMRSLKILERLEDRRVMTYVFCSIAEAYAGKGELGQAMDYCKRALDLSKEIGIKESIAYSKKLFGVIYASQGDWEQSISNFEESIQLFGSVGDEKELGDTHYEFGLRWKEKGEEEEARRHLNKALEIFKGIGAEKKIEKVQKELESPQTRHD